MRVLNCLIVEDEPLAANLLADYVEKLPGLVLKGVCSNAFLASEKLRAEKIDLIFVDIHLPKLNGLDFIKTLSGNYKIILTTAYHEYALEGFNLNVVDYLLKPIEFSRFMQAVNKVSLPFNDTISPLHSEEAHQPFYFFYTDKKKVRVNFNDIVFVESLKDYVRITTEDSKLVTKLQISELEHLLTKLKFFRIHKSYLVNLKMVKSYTATQVEIKGKIIPVGRVYKEAFLKEMAQYEAKRNQSSWS